MALLDVLSCFSCCGVHVANACSLERVSGITKPAVASLLSLKQLTALTIITAADADVAALTAAAMPAAAMMDLQAAMLQQQQQPVPVADNGGNNMGAAALPQPQHAPATAAAAAAAADEAGRSLYLPLLQLPALQELVLGSAHRSQQLNFTGSITDSLRSNSSSQQPDSNTSAGLQVAGGQQHAGAWRASGSDGGRVGGSNCGRWYQQVGEGVSAFVCPAGSWSDLSTVKVCGGGGSAAVSLNEVPIAGRWLGVLWSVAA